MKGVIIMINLNHLVELAKCPSFSPRKQEILNRKTLVKIYNSNTKEIRRIISNKSSFPDMNVVTENS